MKKSKLEPTTSHKILKNTIYNTVGSFWVMLVNLALTPYILGSIGAERFGIWAIVSILTGYFGLLDFGVGTSFVKYISEFYAKKKYDKINQLVNTGFLFYMLLAIVVAILAFLSIDRLLAIFSIPPSLHGEARFVFIGGIVLFALSNALSVFAAIPNGLQRMDITNKVTIAVSVPMIIGTVYFLENGYGLKGLLVNNAIVLLVTGAVNITVSLRILPELGFSLLSFSKEMFQKLFNFGYKLQIANIGMMVSWSIDKILISHFLSLALVSFYELGQKIAQAGRSLSLLLVSAIIPAVSELDAKNDKASITLLYFRGSKYLSLAAIPLMALIFTTAPSIMSIWVGQGYGTSIGVLRLLTVAYLFHLLTGVAGYIAVGAGKPGMVTKSTFIITVLNLILSSILLFMFGFWGTAVGTSVALILGSCVLMVDFHKYIQRDIRLFAKSVLLKPAFAALSAGLAAKLLELVFVFYNANPNFLYYLQLLTAQTILFSSIYLALILKANYLDAYDKTLVCSLLRLNHPSLKRGP